MKKLIYKDESKRQELNSRLQHGIGEANGIIDAYNATGLDSLKSIDEMKALMQNMKHFVCKKAIHPDLLKNVNLDKYFYLLTAPGLPELENTIKSSINAYHYCLEYAVFKNGRLEIDQVKLDQALNQCDVYAEGVEIQVYELIQGIRQKFDQLNSLTNLRWRDIGTLYTENSYSRELSFNLNAFGQLCKEAVKKDSK